ETGAEARDLRHRLEAFHGRKDPRALETAWPCLGHSDRFVRWAARVAVEWQDPATWGWSARIETNPDRALPALLALIHVSAQDPAHRKPGAPAPDPSVRDGILSALDRLGWDKLSAPHKLDLVRVYQVLFNRFGK